MKYIKSFNLLERNDLSKSDELDNLFDEVISFIENENDFDSNTEILNIPKYIRTDDGLYITFENNNFQFFLCFTWSPDISHGYGNTEIKDGRKIKTIFIPIKKPSTITRDLLLDELKENEFETKHEMTHLYDNIKYKYNSISSTNFLNKAKNIKGSDSDIYYKKYYNTVSEINAYYMMSANNIIKEIKNGNIELLDDFKKFKDYFIKDPSVNNFYFYLYEENKKKFISRCYNLYNDLKVKFKK